MMVRRNNKKFWISATLMLACYIASILILPFIVVDIVFSGIAGWIFGGWIYKAATKFSEYETDDNDELHVV